MKISSLKEFLKKIPTIGIPDKINTKTLPTMGYKSSNDRAIPTILKFISLIDTNCIPNDNYKDFRNKSKSGIIMAKCVRKAYNELYALYPDAHKRSDDELRDFFAPKTTAGEKVLSQIVNTYKALTEFADFTAKEVSIEGLSTTLQPSVKGQLPQLPSQMVGPSEKRELVVNINVQITLPETGDTEVYDKIFEALKKHFFSE